MPVTHSVGVPSVTFAPSASVAYRMFNGMVPCREALRPSGYSPLVNSGIVLSQSVDLGDRDGLQDVPPDEISHERQADIGAVDRARLGQEPVEQIGVFRGLHLAR